MVIWQSFHVKISLSTCVIGQIFRVALLSTLYLNVSRIIIPGFKSIGQNELTN